MAGAKPRPRHSRSTRGCYTCRLRHLKCDESFPCRRCLSAGWQCDGPRSTNEFVFRTERPHVIRRLNTKPPPEPTQLVWLTNSQEKRAFEFYLRRAGPLLSGALDWDFWSSLVPCLAESDVAVRYIVLAISHLCEHPMRTSEDGKIQIHPLNSQHVLALQWQARALSIDRQQDSLTPTSNLILKYCLLASHEFQQNNYWSGWRLLRVAFSLVAPFMITSGCGSSASSASSCGTNDQILKILVPLVMRNLCLLSTSRGRSPRRAPHMTSIDEVESEIFHHLCMVYASIRTHFLAIQPRSHIEHNRSKARRGELRVAMLRLQAETSTAQGSHDQLQPVRCQALHEYCDIGIYWLDIVSDLVHDSSKEPDFLQTILDATKRLSVTAPTLFPAAASADFFRSFTIYPTAFFVTIFSRDPRLRSEALTLLNERTNRNSIPHLLALVRKTEQHTSQYVDDIDENSIFQIYHGSKDRELLVDEVHMHDGSVQ